MFENLLVEKYRPKKLEDMVLSQENRDTILNFKSKQDVPHLIFTGPPGTGKTTLARIIATDILQCTYIYINASDENGIDVIRGKVSNFAQTKSFDGKIKIIILDEADGVTIDGQRALRNTMEEYSQYCRFILTGNFKSRISSPLQSRCVSLDLTPPEREATSRLLYIIKSEGIECDAQSLTNLVKLWKQNYPDLRKTINDIQKSTVDRKLKIGSIIQTNGFFDDLLDELKAGSLESARSIIINNNIFNKDYNGLLRELFNYVDSKIQDDSKKAKLLLIISEHMYRNAFVIDQEINTYACLISLKPVI